jgi:uncharacterized protein
MAHPVVHFEISGPDDRQLADFYAELFGWRMQPVASIDYTLVDTRGGGINGGIAKVAEGGPSVTFYIETDDLQAALDKINLIGGKTATPITELPGMATFALFEDLDGLVVGLVLGAAQTAETTAQPAPAEYGATPDSDVRDDRVPGAAGAPVDWFEVLGTDAARSHRFYAEIFGWQLAPAGARYAMADTGTSRGIRGGIGAGEPGPWISVYASVADVAATLTRATQLGGHRLHGPTAVDDRRQTGALRDPAGNVFGVYHHAPR